LSESYHELREADIEEYMRTKKRFGHQLKLEPDN